VNKGQDAALEASHAMKRHIKQLVDGFRPLDDAERAIVRAATLATRLNPPLDERSRVQRLA